MPLKRCSPTLGAIIETTNHAELHICTQRFFARGKFSQMKPILTLERYDFVAQMLHWVMAGLLLYLLFLSHFETVPDTIMEGKIKLHSSLGFLVLVLGLFRFYWRKTRANLLPQFDGPRWQVIAANVTHRTFYVLFLVAPAAGFVLAGLVAYPVRLFGFLEMSGWLADNEGAAELMNSVHGFAADLILYFLILHVAAAHYHHFVKRDGLIWRMIPPEFHR